MKDIEFVLLLETLIQNHAYFRRKSEKSNTQRSSVKLFEFLNMSFVAMKDALFQLRSSLDSESFSNLLGNVFQRAAAIDPTVATLLLRVQCLRAESTLTALLYQLKALSGNEVSAENNTTEATGVLKVVQMTHTLQERLAELATRSVLGRNKLALITKLDALERYKHQFTPAVYALANVVT